VVVVWWGNDGDDGVDGDVGGRMRWCRVDIGEIFLSYR